MLVGQGLSAGANVDAVQFNLSNWETHLVKSMPLGGLVSRNEVAYKWKGLFRCWVLRETILWRCTDLITQSYELHKLGHVLGARVLARSTLETLAILIYLSQQIRKVLDSELCFHEFSTKTARLLLGSKNKTTDYETINIVTVLEHCDKKYPRLKDIYGDLSESAHPNCTGLLEGYSSVDHVEKETHFSNRWSFLFGATHVALLEMIIEIFLHEYNDVWVEEILKLEKWLVENDATLEATKAND